MNMRTDDPDIDPQEGASENYECPENGAIRPSLARIDALGREIDREKAIHADLWPLVLRKLKVRWTTESNAIEGSRLSFGDTLFFLSEGLTVKGKPFKDYLDARNHAEAIEWLFDVVADRRPISTSLLKEMNAMLLHGVKETPAVDEAGRRVMKPAEPGTYKRAPNHVLLADGSVHHYVPPLQVPGQMERLCAWIEQARGKAHPIVVAAIAHYNMVRVHPFDDGNGRGARILMNLILMQASLPPAVIRVEDREDYLAAIRAADRGDLRPFIERVAMATIETQEEMLCDLRGAEAGG